MKKQIFKAAILSLGLALSNQATAKFGIQILEENGVQLSHEEMVHEFTQAKNDELHRIPADKHTVKSKKYKERADEPFEYWEAKIYRDLSKTYSKKFKEDIVPNIDKVIARTDLTPNQKAGLLLDVQSEYPEKAAIEVWNRLISQRPDSKNARSAFCKVAAETFGIKGQRQREKRGEICDKNFQLNPDEHFNWPDNRTPEVIRSVIIAPKLK